MGFHFNLASEGDELCLHFAKHFVIGVTPPKLLAEIPFLFLKCLISPMKPFMQIGIFESVLISPNSF